MIKRTLFPIVFLCLLLTGCASMEATSFKEKAYNKITDWTEWDENTDKGLEYLLKSAELNPDNEEVLKNIGRLYYVKGNYDKAEAYLQKAIKLNEEYGIAWNNIGWVYEQKALYSKMKDAFEKAIKYRKDSDAWDQIGLGRAYYHLQEFDLAEKHFRKVLKMKNEENSIPIAKKYLGFVLFEKGKVKEAVQLFKDYISSYPQKHIANRDIGRFYYDEGSYDKAEAYLRKAINLNKEYGIAWKDLGLVYEGKTLYSKMKDAFEKAIKHRKIPDAWDQIGLGRAHYNLHKYDLAEERFRKALKMKNEGNSKLSAKKYLGFVLFTKGKQKQAEQLFEDFISSYPEKHIANRDIGRFYYDIDNYDKAESYLQKAINLNEEYGIVWNNIGWVYNNKALYSKMRDAFEKAIKYDSGFKAWDQIGLGLAYYNLQKYDLAEEHFQKVLNMANRANSKHSVKKYLGYTLYKKGKPKEAEQLFKDYISSYPKKHEASSDIGRFYYGKEKLDLAEKYLKESIKIDNEYELAWITLGWLYWKKGQYKKMNAAFKQAVKVLKYKEDTSYYIGLGASYYYLGNYSKAEELFKHAEKLIKNDDERLDLVSFWILLAAKQGDFGLVKKLWSDSPSLGVHTAIENNEGLIHFIWKGHLAELAGLQVGDRIVNIDGEPLVDNGSLKWIVKKLEYGKSIDVVIRRGEQKFTKRIVLDYLHYLPQSVSDSLAQVADTDPPIIKILTPNIKKQGNKKILTDNNQILIKGVTKDKSGIHQIHINGVAAKVSSSGEFWQTIRLAYGSNLIRVAATDLKQNIAKMSFNIERTTDTFFAEDNLDNDIKPLETGKYHALIIAVQDYTYDSVSDLSYPISDAMRLKELLQEDYTFDEKNIVFLKNPDRKAIIKELDILAKKLEKDSNLIIFFAGHGHWDKKFQQGYWIPSNARWEEKSEWIANSTISNYLRGISTQHSLIISDACFSGSIFKTKTPFSKSNKSMHKIYSRPSRKAMTSGAMETVPDKSVFLEYLIKRLKKNKERYFKAISLYDSIIDAVINNSPTSQTPLYGVVHQSGDEGGDFIFVHR
jgi:tetratricopeptide (TPR) repeat protein